MYTTRYRLHLLGLLCLTLTTLFPAQAQTDTQKIRIIMIGAHPDDCDLKGGGTAALLSSMGYAVKFVSVTNGDAGELLPTLAVRLQIIKKIREWNADVVISPRPNDYHPDHRYTGVLVQDAAYMVAVPNVAPETPRLQKNPVFLYFQDHFQRPNPFRPDVAIDISSVYTQKVHALDAHQSQVYEWLPWIGGFLDKVPTNKAEQEKWLGETRAVKITPDVRASLEKWYGKDKAAQVQHAEAFEVCEYGARPTDEDLKRIFPMMK